MGFFVCGWGFFDVLLLIVFYSDTGYSTFLLVLVSDLVGKAERGKKLKSFYKLSLHVTQIRPQVLSSRKTIFKDPQWKKNSITATCKKHNYGFVFSFRLMIAGRSYTEVPKAEEGL